MKYMVVLFLSLVCFPTLALKYYGAVGAQSLQERGEMQTIEERRLKNISLGIGREYWLAFAEVASFQATTGSGSVSVDRNVEQRALAGYIFSDSWNWARPMVGAGIGYTLETIDTNLIGAISRDVSRPNYFIFGSLGISLDVPIVWLSAELRVYEFERADPNPTAGILCKIGLTL